MAVNFPDSPSNGDSFSVNDTTYVYNATAGYWDITSTVQASASTSTNAPSNPSTGDFWFDPSALTTYIYYSDGSSSQWVPANSVGARGAPGPGYPTAYYSVDYTSTATGNVVFNSSSSPTLPSYTVGKVNAWVNGVLRSDINASDGSNVEISLSTGDEVQIINFGDTDVLDPTASSNDHTTYTTLSSLIDTVQANVTSAGSGVAVYATPDLLPLSGINSGEQAYVNSTNRLYINNGTGWYSIGLVNNNPSITAVQDASAGTTPFTLATDGSATVITITASDPEDVPLTYSYAVTSGSLTNGGGATATVVQGTGANTNKFTITPSATEAYAGTFELTFTTSDGINTATSANSFTLQFITTITNSKYTTLLATATDTSDNNNITDSSTNNHTITVAGDAHAGTFSPYRSGGYSMYFDGSDYVDLGNGNLAINTEDFTIETWVNVTLGSNMSIANNSNWSGGDNTGWRVRITTGGLINLTASQGSWNSYPSIYTSTNAIPSNEWVHVVICRDSGVISSYINGIKDPTTVNYSASLNQTGGSSLSSYSFIGAYIADGNEYNNLTGYLSDFHFKLGSAKYTTTFSPPTERLTVESGTDVLLFNKPFLKDESTNAYTTSISGDPKIKPFSPYDYDEYSATDHGGSVYFDGTTDYLLINSPPTLGANDWTFETWYYASNPLTHNNLLSQGPGNNTVVSNFSISVTGEIWIQTYDGSNVVLYNTAAGIIKADTWNHIVLTHDYDGSNGGTYKIYVNGNQVGSNVSYTSGYYWNSGGIAGTALGMAQYRYNTQANGKCYFSDWKISSGVTYSSNFTPPTAPLSSSGSVLHIKGTDASIIDKSQRSVLQAVGTVGTTTSVNFAGTKSIDFSTISNDYYIKIPSKNQGGPGFPNLFTSPCTIECWINPTHVQANGLAHKIVWFLGSGNTYILFQQENTDNLRLTVRSGGTQFFNQETSNSYKLAANTWQHVCFMSNAGATSCSLYLNGTRVMSGNLSTGLLDTSGNDVYFSFGSSGPGTPWAGYASDIKISTYNVYGSPSDTTITPPTAPLEG